MARRRVVFLDEPEPDGWTLRSNRFEALAAIFAAAGHEATLVGCAPPAGSIAGVAHIAAAPPPAPILTGLNHALETAPLTRAHDLARVVGALDPDLVIAPFGGGLAHGLAMARACGEGFANMRIALWVDRPTRTAMLDDDDATEGLRPLVADALERATLARADALVAPDAMALTRLAPLATALPPAFFLRLPGSPCAGGSVAPKPARRLAFVGRFARDSGAVAFIDALESLDRQGRLRVESVDFIGPHRLKASGPGADWMALRAASWRFAFSFHDERDPRAALARLARGPDALAILAAEDGALLPFADDAAHGRLAFTSEALRAPDFAEILARALAGSPSVREPVAVRSGEWLALADKLLQAPPRAIAGSPPAPGVSILVLHKDRPRLLPHALASAPRALPDGAPLETVLIDNGSTTPEAQALLDRLDRERAGTTRILRLTGWRHATAAYNSGAAAARHGVLVFLDDDNAFVDEGAARLARGVREGAFDVVVSTLAVFENAGAAPGAVVAHMSFIGEAGAAGLFFNAFGDTAMAIRRDLFLDIGGFPVEDGVCPSFDWVLLAKARAAGARIGVLQRPAVLYRRDEAHASGVWMKFDREHARSRVFAAYAGAYDGDLAARYAQKRHIADI